MARGEFELVVSEALLAELTRALAYPKIHERTVEDEARAFVELLARQRRSRPTRGARAPLR